MKKLLLIWLLLGLYSVSQAQTVTIHDQTTGNPVELVTLNSTAPFAYAVTNALGQADISGFKDAGEIAIRRTGYTTLTLSYAEIEDLNFMVFLHPSQVEMDRVIVSATRWRQTRGEVASRVSVISPQQVEVQNPQTAADLLGISGGVYIQKSQLGGGSPMIRGFSTNRLLYTVDGIRMNTAIFRSGNLQNVISLDPFAMESTEVLFGPASVIYGSDALGGVMSFNTLTPGLSATDELLTSGSVQARVSSAAQEKTYHFDVTAASKKWGSVTSFSNFNFGNLEMGSHGPSKYLRPEYATYIDGNDVAVANPKPKVQKSSGYSQTNLMQKIRYRPSDKWDITYGLHYSETSDYDRYDRLIEYDNSGVLKSGQWYYGPQIWAMNNLTISTSTSSALADEAAVRLAYQYFEESRHDRKFNNTRLRSRYEKVFAYSFNLDLLKNITPKQQLFYGIEAVYDDVKSTGTGKNIQTGAVAPVAPRYPKSDWSSFAAYANYVNELSQIFTLQAGVRYNHFLFNAKFDDTFYDFPFNKAEINDGAVTGSLGFIVRPEKTTAIHAVLSTGFRAPNVDDAGKVFDSEPGAVVVPNPDLKSEYAYNAELGISKIVNRVFEFSITGFYTYLDNAMVRRDFTLNGQDYIMYDGQLSRVQAIQNAANATIYGIQIGTDIVLPAGFEFSGQFNIQEGEEELDDGTKSPARHTAPWFGTGHLKYRANRLLFDFYGVYNQKIAYKDLPVGEQGKAHMYAEDKDGNPYSPQWLTLNLKASYETGNIFSFSAGVENITDRRYRPYSSGIVSPGRNLIFSVKASF